jgi:hypothetical protein
VTLFLAILQQARIDIMILIRLSLKVGVVQAVVMNRELQENRLGKKRVKFSAAVPTCQHKDP